VSALFGFWCHQLQAGTAEWPRISSGFSRQLAGNGATAAKNPWLRRNDTAADMPFGYEESKRIAWKPQPNSLCKIKLSTPRSDNTTIFR
jgi:hypothetical protein